MMTTRNLTNLLRSLKAAACNAFLVALGLSCCAGTAQAVGIQLRITEAYFNPDGNDTGTEWVEIQNTSGAPIDFSATPFRLAWSRSGTETTGWTVGSSVPINSGILAPGAYAVIGPNGTANSKPRNGNPAMGNGAGVLFISANINALRNDTGSSQSTGIGLISGSTFVDNTTPVSSVFFGVNAPTQAAKNSSGVVQTTVDYNNSGDVQGFELKPGSLWITSPRGGTPGWGLTEDLNGTPSFGGRWSTTPTVIVPNGFAAANGMQQTGGTPATSDYSSLVFNSTGNLVVTIDDESIFEVHPPAWSFVRGSSAASNGNPLVTVQGANQGYVANQGDFEGITFNPLNSKYYTLNERGADTTHPSQLYRMSSNFTVEATYAFTDADFTPVDTERNFGTEAVAYIGTFGGKIRLAVGHEGTRGVYIYDLDESTNTLTRVSSLLIGSLYNENPKDLYYDPTHGELYVIDLSGNLQQFDLDPVTGAFGALLGTYRLPEAYRELGPEGMTIGSDGTLYIAQDGGAVLTFAPVPEPATIVLLGVGLPALLLWKKRRPA